MLTVGPSPVARIAGDTAPAKALLTNLLRTRRCLPAAQFRIEPDALMFSVHTTWLWPSVASPDEYDAARTGRRSDTPRRTAEQASKREGCS